MKFQQLIRHRQLGNAVFLYAGNFLLIPSGILLVVYLSGRLSPADYGTLLVASAVVSWVKLATTQIFNRLTIKLVADTGAWQSMTVLLAQWQLIISFVIVCVIFAVAPIMADWLRQAQLTDYLRLLALEVPFFAVAQIYGSALVGRERYRARALLTGGRWLMRLGLTVLLVEVGLSIWGAIIASVATGILEWLAARLMASPLKFIPVQQPKRIISQLAFSIMLYALSYELFIRLDLLMIKALIADPQAAGLYGAAQNLIIPARMIGWVLSPMFISRLSHKMRDGEPLDLKRVVNSIPALLLVLFGGIWGAVWLSQPLLRLVMDEVYVNAGMSLFGWLIWSGMAMSAINIYSAICIALNRMQPLARIVLAVPAALLLHVLVIPVWGYIGAAVVTTVVATAAAASLYLWLRAYARSQFEV